VLAPDGAEVTAAPVTRHIDNAMIKAIARAFRWRDSWRAASMRPSGRPAAEKIKKSYVGRVLGPTLLAPDIARRFWRAAAG